MRDRLTTLLYAIVAVLTATSCVKPCEGTGELRQGERFTVTIVAPYVEGGDYPYQKSAVPVFPEAHCNGFDGLRTGAVLQMRVADTFLVSESCLGWALQVEAGPPELTLGTRNTPYKGPTAVVSSHQMMIGDCEGEWKTWFRRNESGSIFDPPVPELMPVIAVREFSPRGLTNSNELTCQSCRDGFVVHLEKKR